MKQVSKVTITVKEDGTFDIKLDNWLGMTVSQMERIQFELYRAVQRERAAALLRERQEAAEAAAKKDEADFTKELGNVLGKP